MLKKIIRADVKKYIIIEKPLFCNRDEYEFFANVSNTTIHKIYCNTPHYYNTSLLYLSSLKNLGKVLSYKASGSNWGLCCNLLHDISILDCITGANEFNLSNFVALTTSITESKRAGYFEVFGSLHFSLNKIDCSISCSTEEFVSKVSKITFSNGKVIIDHVAETMSILSKDGKSEDMQFFVAKASATTGDVGLKLLENRNILPYASKYSSLSLEIYSKITESCDIQLKSELDFPFS